MQRDADVIIVGAGIAGLGLACALARHEVRVLLIEKRRTCGGIHRGDSLLPKATRLLARWGVFDALLAAEARPIDRMEIHCKGHGHIYSSPLTREGEPPYVVLPHAKIESVLMDSALATGFVELIRPAKVTGVLERGGVVHGVSFKGAAGEGEATARLVVGTDGHKSVVRAGLGIEARPYHYDHAYLGLEADRPAAYQDAMRVHFHPRGGVLLMPRPDRVGVGVLVDAGSAGDWMGLDQEGLRRALIERAPILDGMKIHRDGAHVYALTRAHVPRYVAKGAVIVGDAAHCTNPTAGQGMAMALADAGALADHLGPVLRDPSAALGGSLAAFEAEQWPRNQHLVRTSHILAKLYALRGRGWDRFKTTLVRLMAHPMGVRLVSPAIDNFLSPTEVDRESAPGSAPTAAPETFQARSSLRAR